MATSDQITELRAKAGIVNDDTYGDDVALSALIDASASVDAAAGDLWRRKAATYADLVDTSESGSSRSLSQLHRNAIEMSRFFGATPVNDDPLDGRLVARSRRAVREGGF